MKGTIQQQLLNQRNEWTLKLQVKPKDLPHVWRVAAVSAGQACGAGMTHTWRIDQPPQSASLQPTEIKSIEMDCHGRSGIGKGWSKPAAFFSVLSSWHTMHVFDVQLHVFRHLGPIIRVGQQCHHPFHPSSPLRIMRRLLQSGLANSQNTSPTYWSSRPSIADRRGLPGPDTSSSPSPSLVLDSPRTSSSSAIGNGRSLNL